MVEPVGLPVEIEKEVPLFRLEASLRCDERSKPRAKRCDRTLELVRKRREDGGLEAVGRFESTGALRLESRTPAVEEQRRKADQGRQHPQVGGIGMLGIDSNHNDAVGQR